MLTTDEPLCRIAFACGMGGPIWFSNNSAAWSDPLPELGGVRQKQAPQHDSDCIRPGGWRRRDSRPAVPPVVHQRHESIISNAACATYSGQQSYRRQSLRQSAVDQPRGNRCSRARDSRHDRHDRVDFTTLAQSQLLQDIGAFRVEQTVADDVALDIRRQERLGDEVGNVGDDDRRGDTKSSPGDTGAF